MSSSKVYLYFATWPFAFLGHTVPKISFSGRGSPAEAAFGGVFAVGVEDASFGVA
jgi:hypothetical protein